MTAYRRNGGTVTRTNPRVRIAGTVLGSRQVYSPVTPPPPPSGITVNAVPIGSGGYVTGLAIANDGTRWCRTDVGGAYKWSTAENQWKQVVTHTSMPAPHNGGRSLLGAAGLAVDPTNGARAFLHYDNTLFRTTDSGTTWTPALTDVQGVANGTDWRSWGPSITVDPNNTQVIYLGVETGGLRYTRDGGTTWSTVPTSSLPAGGAAGIRSVTVDPSGGTVGGRSAVVYAAPHGSGVYKSTDGGDTWTKISNDTDLTVTRKLVVGTSGDLWVVALASTTPTVTDGNGKVWLYRSGVWSAKVAVSEPWNNVAVQGSTIVALASAPGLMVSTDNGATFNGEYGHPWNAAKSTWNSEGDVAWNAWAMSNASSPWMTIGSAKFDPAIPGRMVVTEGIGVWYHDVRTTYDAAHVVDWHSVSRGIEELIASHVSWPPGGVPIGTAHDRPVWRMPSLGNEHVAPAVSVGTVSGASAHKAVSLDATLSAGWPIPAVAWSVVTKPSGSTIAPAHPGDLHTTAVPDIPGDYTVRVTATNAYGTATADVSFAVAPPGHVLRLPGTTGNYASTPDHADFNFTAQSFAVIVKAAMTDASPGADMVFVSQWAASGTEQAWMFKQITSGWSQALLKNAAQTQATASSSNANLSDGVPRTLAMEYDHAAKTVTFFVSDDDGATWTQPRAAVDVSTASGSMANPTSAAISVGQLTATINPAPLAGDVYFAKILRGNRLTGTEVANFEPSSSSVLAGAASGTRNVTSFTDSHGKVWTVNGTGWTWEDPSL